MFRIRPKGSWIAWGFVCLLLSASQLSAAPKVAGKPEDWKMLGSGTTVLSGNAYTLRNITYNESIRYGSRRWGINLVWAKSTTLNNIRFERQGAAKGTPLKYGDVVAIHVQNGGYLHYRNRDIGVNLGWSKTPVHQFVIRGGQNGQPVRMNQPFSLFNQFEDDFLIYGERPSGINLRWWKDRHKAGEFLDRAKEKAKDAAKDAVKKVL